MKLGEPLKLDSGFFFSPTNLASKTLLSSKYNKDKLKK